MRAPFRSPRAVVWAAFRAGGLSSAVLVPSPRSPSGWVLRFVFRSGPAAASFARFLAVRFGWRAVVRSRVLVSVPVFVRSSRPVGVARPVSAVGGLVPFAAAVRSAGWVSLRC